METSLSLGEALPLECARCRKILSHCREIGTGGIFLSILLEQTLAAADQAMIQGDVGAMIAAYQALQGFSE